MKFCFSSMWMTFWLCQKQSKLMKDFEICYKLNSRSKTESLTHPGCPCVVCEEWDLTLSTPVDWRHCSYFLFSHRNKFYTLMKTHSTPKKFLESEDDRFDPHLYHQLIGHLVQLATWTRPDFSYAASIFSQCFSNAARRHYIGSKNSQLPQNFSRFRSFL